MSTHDLAREVFGGSESELSSDEDDLNVGQNQQRKEIQHKPRHARPQRQNEDESSGGESEDDYRDAEAQDKPRLNKEKRVRTGKPLARKRKHREVTGPDLSKLTPEQRKKVQLDMQIEAILKPKKASRPRKKKNNEEVLDSFADDEVARLREAMNAAADDDQRANSEKQPASAKLRLLPEAMETLQKAALAQSMIDNNLLEAVRRWLEPLPDRSLPALNIQRELFTTLRKMEFIDSAVLKESGLGRVVLFYTKCKRVTPAVAVIANELVGTWSRPIIKRSASYRDKVVPVFETGGEGEGGGMRGEKLNAILARAKEKEKNRVRKNAVMIPQRELGTYTVAPRANAGLALSGRGGTSVDEDVQRRKTNAERLRMLTRKVGGLK